MAKPKSRRRFRLRETRLIALIFLLVIAVGTLLLMLPVSARDGRSCGVLPALFTATSATCVTGLSLADTWTMWSGFGQAVILALIEIGGLGFMSALSFFLFLLRQKIGIRQRTVMAQAVGVDNLGGILKLQKIVLWGSLTVQSCGAILLTLRFVSRYPLGKSIWLGIFHSVSAFCNAGFDIFGFEDPGGSVMMWGNDPFVLLTLAARIIIGGLGFLVWQDLLELFSRKPQKRLRVYTKLVLITTAVLLAGGTVCFLALEWNNPATIGGKTIGEKLLAAFFQSATLRTAGFSGISQGALTDPGKAASLFFMLIGGASGSTAGGLKTATLAVLFLFLIARARGKSSVTVFSRTIPSAQVLNALTLAGLMVSFSFLGGVLLSATSAVPFLDGLYESVSAIATVGLSTGITASLGVFSKLLIIVYMYFGRVGILTISLGFLLRKPAEERASHAETNLLIG